MKQKLPVLKNSRPNDASSLITYINGGRYYNQIKLQPAQMLWQCTNINCTTSPQIRNTKKYNSRSLCLNCSNDLISKDPQTLQKRSIGMKKTIKRLGNKWSQVAKKNMANPTTRSKLSKATKQAYINKPQNRTISAKTAKINNAKSNFGTSAFGKDQWSKMTEEQKKERFIKVVKANKINYEKEFHILFNERTLESGFQVLQYEGSSGNSTFTCPNGHTFKMISSNFLKRLTCTQCAPKSTPEFEIKDFIHSISPELEIIHNSRKIINPFELDLYMPSLQFAIEYNGLYFHSSAIKEFKINKERNKAKLCEEKGIKLFMIFEDEWLNPQKKELIKKMIAWRIKKAKVKHIHAKQLQLVRLEKNEDFAEFFEKNHIDGTTQASFAYALKDKTGKIITCASFRPKSFSNKNELELARFATDTDYHVIDGLAKLLTEIKVPLITYSNNRIGNGDIYKKNGFKEITETTNASYYYTDFQVRFFRTKCPKMNFLNMVTYCPPAVSLADFPFYDTEETQARGGFFGMKLFGKPKKLYRIEDCGHRKWIKFPLE